MASVILPTSIQLLSFHSKASDLWKASSVRHFFNHYIDLAKHYIHGESVREMLWTSVMYVGDIVGVIVDWNNDASLRQYIVKPCKTRAHRQN